MASSELKLTSLQRASIAIKQTIDRSGHQRTRLTTSVFRVAAILLLLQTTAVPAWARRRQEPAVPDAGYVAALATANRFLLAWQSGDLANGIVLLSDCVRHSQSVDQLEEFFSAGSERGFEIGAGRGNRKRYSFPVVLVTEKAGRCSRRSSFIVLALSGKNDWVVDKLP